MYYLKVEWIHDFVDEPYLIYGELNSELEEIRKIEAFRSGKLGYAHIDGTECNCLLSECSWSNKDEIESDPQFKVFTITQKEFENIWTEAVNQNNV